MALLHVDFFSDVLGMCVEMDVILPETLFKKMGMPHFIICFVVLKENLGLVSLSWSFPRAKSENAISAQALKQMQGAKAALQMSSFNTNKKKNSRRAVEPLAKILSHMLSFTLPDIFK